LGPAELAYGLAEWAWPLLFALAQAHRRTLLRSTRLVAVVGTYGKTTAARAVSAVLLGAPRMNYPWSGAALAVLGTRPGQGHAVVEAAINARGQMARYARMLRPDVVVVTSIGSEHNRMVGPIEATRTEKAEILRRLGPAGTAIVNGDDPHVRWMAKQTRARCLRFGLDPAHDVGATDVRLEWPHGTLFRLHAAGTVREVRTRLVGRHMVYPILAAVAVGLAEGWELDRILPSLESLEPTPARMQPVRLPRGAWILRDDIKGGAETIVAALDTLAEIPARQRIVVLGESHHPPGDAEAAHRAFGEHAARVGDRLVLVTDDYLAAYRAGAERAGLAAEAVHAVGASWEAAVDVVAAHLGVGDVVLVKGTRAQRLGRVALALAGRTVRCDLPACAARVRCDHCPMLERGWSGRRVPFTIRASTPQARPA
jgi:UDP-N-acetylmuramoyl-tripeptide--D-alanyl-D-alanine ligase